MNYIPPAIALFIGLLVVAYIVWPLLGANAESLVTDTSDEALELIQRKDSVLHSIKELEFDYQTGKLNEEDYSRFNYTLRRQAVTLLKKIDESTPELAVIDQELEAEIAEARNKATPETDKPQDVPA